MTKEVFTQEFEKCFTIYQQVELIKEYIRELEIPTELDYLPIKTLSFNITDKQLAQVFIDNDITNALLNGKYVVGRVYTPAGPTSNESYNYFVFDLSTGFRYLIRKGIGTTISYSNERITYLTDSAEAAHIQGDLKWGRRQEYDADLSFEITITDVDNNNTISGELLIGNYVAYMTNNYWTIGLDNDILTIASDVESGMGIRGGTTNDTTYMEMYAGENKLSIDSSVGLSINDVKFGVQYEHSVEFTCSYSSPESDYAEVQLIIKIVNDTPESFTSDTFIEYLQNYPYSPNNTTTFDLVSPITIDTIINAKFNCFYYGAPNFTISCYKIEQDTYDPSTKVATYRIDRISFALTTPLNYVEYGVIGIRNFNSDIVKPILVSNI